MQGAPTGKTNSHEKLWASAKVHVGCYSSAVLGVETEIYARMLYNAIVWLHDDESRYDELWLAKVRGQAAIGSRSYSWLRMLVQGIL